MVEINGKKIDELGLAIKGNTLIVYDESFNRDLLFDFATESYDKDGKPRFAFFYRLLYALFKENNLLPMANENNAVAFKEWLDEVTIDAEDMKYLMQLISESPKVKVAKKK